MLREVSKARGLTMSAWVRGCVRDAYESSAKTTRPDECDKHPGTKLHRGFGGFLHCGLCDSTYGGAGGNGGGGMFPKLEIRPRAERRAKCSHCGMARTHPDDINDHCTNHPMCRGRVIEYIHG